MEFLFSALIVIVSLTVAAYLMFSSEFQYFPRWYLSLVSVAMVATGVYVAFNLGEQHVLPLIWAAGCFMAAPAFLVVKDYPTALWKRMAIAVLIAVFGLIPVISGGA